MTKRFFAALIVLVLAVSMCSPAFAANIGIGSSDVGTVSIAVTGHGGSSGPVYHIVLNWDSLTFTYDLAESETTWDPDDHRYESSGRGNAGWVNDSAGITVTNHSNTDIGVNISFEGGGTEKTVNNVTATLTNASFTLATGVGRDYASADSNAATVTVSNAPSVESGFDLGKIVISITDI